MGKLMLYSAGRAMLSQCCHATSDAYGDTPTYKTLDGQSYSKLGYAKTAAQAVKVYGFCQSLTGYVSADTVEDFSLDHYTTRELANISYSRTEAGNVNGRAYTITATNNNASAVTVGSIKFTKTINYATSGAAGDKVALISGYFLDTPVTIEAGATKTFAVNIDCWNY